MQEILLIVVSYLIGSIPSGVWYSKIFHKIDVRQLGSGNSGGTNIGRNFGSLAAVCVITVDVLKGWLPMAYAYSHYAGQEDLVVMLTGIACVLGHAYPIWANFKGGKIVATSIGVLLGYHFTLALVQVALLLALILTTSIVSLASMTSYCLVVSWIILTDPPLYKIGFTLIALLMIYRHRQNIQRLVRGEERHVSFGLNKAKKKKS